ncbi:hypothetical protein KC321_g24 [Hortaea werneckii]|nr:hypothetical protein KC321_g24 [Hortaea werneckii]
MVEGFFDITFSISGVNCGGIASLSSFGDASQESMFSTLSPCRMNVSKMNVQVSKTVSHIHKRLTCSRLFATRLCLSAPNGKTANLQLGQNGFGTRDLDSKIASASLTVPSFSMIMAQRPFLSPMPASQPWFLLKNCAEPCQPMSHLGTVMPPIQTYRLAIAHELELAVRLHAINLAPGAHHKGIVGCNDHHHVHTLVRDLVQVLNVRWDVEGLAAGREGAWNRHNHHLLALELFGCLEGGRHRAGLGIVVLDRGVGEDYALGELVAGFERRHDD